MKLQYDETLSNFAFNLNLRRYSVAVLKRDTSTSDPDNNLTCAAMVSMTDVVRLVRNYLDDLPDVELVETAAEAAGPSHVIR